MLYGYNTKGSHDTVYLDKTDGIIAYCTRHLYYYSKSIKLKFTLD